MTNSLDEVEQAAGNRVSRADFLAWTLLAFGIVVRFRQWTAGRSLWADEATLSINLLGRNLVGLLGPLEFGQMAPPGYLWLVKGIISLTGPGELSLRALAMLAGIGMTLAGWWLTRLHFGPWPAAAAAAMLALSPGAIYYSNEAKPYSTDALVAVLLLLVGTWLLDRELTWRRIALLTLLGGTAVWVSYPAPFTLVGMGFALAMAQARRSHWRAVLQLAAVCAAWAVSWGVVYHLATRGATYNGMHQYWRDQFLDLSLGAPNRTVTALVLALDTPSQPFRSPLDQWNGAERITALLLALLALGIWALASRRMAPSLCLLLAAPVMALTAAAAHLYPLEGRLLQFMLPSVVVVTSGGVWFLNSRGLLPVAALFVAITLIWPCFVALQTLRSPAEREDAMSLLRELTSKARPGDTVYVWHGLGSSVNFYRLTRPSLWPAGVQPFWAALAANSMTTHLEETNQHLQEIGWLCGRARVWLAVVHLHPPNVHRDVLTVLRTGGTIVTSQKFEGAELTLLDLRNMPCPAKAAGP